MAVFTVFLLVVLPTVVYSYSESKIISVILDKNQTEPTNFRLTSLENLVNLSDTLSLTVAIQGHVDNSVQDKNITLNVTTPDGIVPLYDAHVFNMTDKTSKSIMVNFTSNVAPNPQRIPVNIIISLSVLNYSISVTVQLTVDRGE